LASIVIGIQLVDIGGFSIEYNKGIVVPPPTNHVPLAYVIDIAILFIIFAPPVSFVLDNAIGTQLSSTGGVRVEYAIAFVPSPTATHVPFAYDILRTLLENVLADVGIPIQLSAVGGFAFE
jgi:hypothetical protein